MASCTEGVVELTGLTGRLDLNGAVGVVLNSDAASGRVSVQVFSRKEGKKADPISVKVVNLKRPEVRE